MKRAVLALVAALMVASIAWGAYLLWGVEKKQLPPPPPPVDAQQIEALYALTLPDLDGRPQPLSQWRGRVLVINYWATWCLPCRDEMPMFSALQTRYAARGVQFVGIGDEPADTVRTFVQRAPASYPLLLGDKRVVEMSAAFGNTAQGLPFTLVLDRNGRPQSAALGRVDETALTQALDRLARQ